MYVLDLILKKVSCFVWKCDILVRSNLVDDMAWSYEVLFIYFSGKRDAWKNDRNNVNVKKNIIKLFHSANSQSRPVGIIVFAHVVHPSPLIKSSKKQRKQCSLLEWLWVWPSGSLMTRTCLVMFVLPSVKICTCLYNKIRQYFTS